MASPLRDLVASFEPISLVELEESAALQRRVDNKYLITAEQFGLRDDFCLVETKSRDGDSPADRPLAEIGVEPRSFSKYQVGTQVLSGAAGDVDPEVADALS